MFSYDFFAWNTFALLVFVMFVIVVFRYFLVAGFFFFFFYIWEAETWEDRKLTKKDYAKGQFQKEIAWSIVTSLIFAFAGAITVLLWQSGFTQIYFQISDYGYVYFVASIFIAMLIHETYYYWLHRWMHYPKIYRIVHKVHHDSLVTSPWTAFSFHPLEAVLEAIVLPLMVLFLPLHPYIIVLQLTIMTLSSVINHLDIEIYPSGFEKHWLGKWIIGATHHSLHHTQFRFNFGLYFTFWDKWMRTESPIYTSKVVRADTNHGEK